jgi:hypothetical protein
VAPRKSRPSNGTDRSDSSPRPSSKSGREREEFPDYAVFDPEEAPEGPDVLVDVPVVKVDKIDIDVEDLQARVAVLARVRNLVSLSVGAYAGLGEVQLQIEGVEAQVLLKARLDNVSRILERVLLSLDRNPELLEGVGHAVEEVGSGAGHLLDQSGETLKHVGVGAREAIPEVGRGASAALGDVGQGASRGVAGAGRGAARGVEGVGQGVEQGVGQLGDQQEQQQQPQQTQQQPQQQKRQSRGGG